MHKAIRLLRSWRASAVNSSMKLPVATIQPQEGALSNTTIFCAVSELSGRLQA
jgi:hypothetical protein